MSATYVYLLTDLATDEPLEELPLDCQSFERKIKGSGDLRATLDLSIDEVRVLDLPSLLAFGRRALYVLRDDEVVWGGILWRGTRSQSDNKISLQAVEFESYFDRRLWDDDYQPVQVDQLDIARTLTSLAAGSLGLVVEQQQSGVLRDSSTDYLRKDRHTVGEVLANLADLEGGFDYLIDTVSDGATRQRLLRFGYPRLGRTADVSELVFESPGSITEWTDDYDALGSVTRQYELGGQVGEGDAAVPLQALAVDVATEVAGALPLEAVSTEHSTVTEQATLDGWARTDLAAAPLPVATFTATVRGDADPQIGTYIPGDEARFEVTDDWWRARPDGSPGLQVVLRILALSVNPSTDLVTLTLGPAVR